jgi:glycogen(starch) synthase
VKKLSLAVFNTQPPHLYFGGVERRIIEMARRLHDDVKTTVYSGTKAGFKKPVSVNGTVIVPCFSTDTLFPLDNWFFNHTISGAAGTIKADIYEAHTVSGYKFLKTLRKRNLKAPFIQTIHGVLADEYYQALSSGSLSPRARLANLLMWHLSCLEAESARNADLIVTVSKYSSSRMVNLYHVDEAKVRVVPNGVDPEKFKPAEPNEELKRRLGVGNKRIVLFVGRLIHRKGLPFLIEAAARAVKEYGDIAFVIVGEGPLRNQLSSEVENLSLSKNFVFLGDVKDSLLPTLYNCADVFVLPSIQEGQGIALLEAQASAKPVVAFNVGGVREAVLDGESGLLVRRGDSDALAEAILKVLSNPPLGEQMGAKGLEYVLGNFTWDKCAERMLNVYREASVIYGQS